MRILILGNNYKPEPTGIGVNTAEFAEEMAGKGHSVTIVTTFPHYPHWRWQQGRRFFATEELDGVRVRRMWTPLPRNRSALWRVLFDSGFAVTSLLNAFRAGRPDVVVAICPPIQLAFTAAVLGKLWRVPTCLWVKDLPLDAAVDVGMMSPHSRAYRLGAALERRGYASCSEIVVLHQRFANLIAEKGVSIDQLVAIPNWVGDIQPMPASDRYRRQLGATPKDFLILHAGNMGAKQGLDNILSAAATIRPDERIRFALMGDGPRRASIVAEATRLKLDMTILPLQPAGEVGSFYAAADALLLDQVANVIDSVVPMKLLSYMAAGKPILAAVHPDSVTAELLREAGCGIVVPPGDPGALAAGARQLASSGDTAKLGDNARRYMEENFATEPVMAKWEELLTTLACRSA